MCMIIFLRIIILSFQSHQTRILNAGLGMAWNRYGLSWIREDTNQVFLCGWGTLMWGGATQSKKELFPRKKKTTLHKIKIMNNVNLYFQCQKKITYFSTFSVPLHCITFLKGKLVVIYKAKFIQLINNKNRMLPSINCQVASF